MCQVSQVALLRIDDQLMIRVFIPGSYLSRTDIAARSEYQATNSTVVTFFQECMCHWPGGKISGSTITTGKIHKAYVQWCRDNNNGYAKSAKEFRDELASHMGTTFADMTTRVHGNTYYKEWTLTVDAQDNYRNFL